MRNGESGTDGSLMSLARKSMAPQAADPSRTHPHVVHLMDGAGRSLSILSFKFFPRITAGRCHEKWSGGSEVSPKGWRFPVPQSVCRLPELQLPRKVGMDQGLCRANLSVGRLFSRAAYC